MVSSEEILRNWYLRISDCIDEVSRKAMSL